MLNNEQNIYKITMVCHDYSNSILPMDYIGNRLGTKRKLSMHKIWETEIDDG